MPDDAALVLGEILELRAVEDADARMRRRVREQQRLEKSLVDPMRRSGVGHQPSSPCSPRRRAAGDGSVMRDSSRPVAEMRQATSLR